MMTRIPSAALLWTFLLLPTYIAAAEPVHIPLSRRFSRAQLDPHAEVHKLKLKYGLVTPNSTAPASRRSSRPGRRASSAGMEIVNQGGASFLGTVNIGTPPQPFSVVLDTGSSDLWVANTQCTKCPRSQPLFDSTKSSSFQGSSTNSLAGQVEIQYGQGQVSGSLVSDTVSMGAFNLPSQTFLSVDQVSDDLAQSATQGIMGLAFAPLANTHATPFWEALAGGNGILSAPEMAFWLQRTDPQTPNEIDAGGIFTLGGVNNSLFTGDIEFLNMPDTPQGPAFWVLNVETITVNGQNIPITTTGGASLAAIDTGTTLLGAPSDAAAAIWNAVGGTPLNDGSGLFEFPCDTKIAVTISFGGKAWTINPEDIIFNEVSARSKLCTGAIFDVQAGTNLQSDPGSGNPVWIVGDTFLKNVYSVFRSQPPSIGFAQLSSLAGGTGAPSTAGSDDQSTPGSSGVGGTGKNGAGMTLASKLVLPVSLMSVAALLLL